MATWNKASLQKYKGHFCRGVMWQNLGLPWKPWNVQKPSKVYFVEGTPVPHFRQKRALRKQVENMCSTIFSTKWETCKIMQNQYNLHIRMLTKPKTSTECGTYSFSHLQNAPSPKSGTRNCISLHAHRLSKKRFWRTPRGPDNGEESFVGMLIIH